MPEDMTGVSDSSGLRISDPHMLKRVAEFKGKWEKKGAIVDAGGDCMMGGIGGIGGGGLCMWENFAHFDPYDKESVEGTFDFFEACVQIRLGEEVRSWNGKRERCCKRARWQGPLLKKIRERILSSAPQPAVFRYQRKIKEAFDPNDLGDAYYVTL